jgi:ribosomal protein S18 acetylase RimI-like enzyme
MSDTLRAIAATPVLHEGPLAKYHPPVHRTVQEGVILVRAVPPAAGPNFVSALGATPAPERVLTLAETFFAGSTEPYELEVDAEYWRDAEGLLTARGFEFADEEPGMVLSPLPTQFPQPPAELVIQRVEDEPTLAAFWSISEGARGRILSVACATDPAVALLVGFVGDRPVATARLVVVRGVADITGVVTEPDYRRRGYGTAMTWAAVREAAARGATAATLTATAMGYPVYLRMGFLHVCTYRTYISPRREPATA